jgi:tRNA modification GTPase
VAEEPRVAGPADHTSATHVQILTPLATGAIAVVQLAGPQALSIAQTVFRPHSGKTLGEYLPKQLTYGDFLDGDGTMLDDGLAFRDSLPDGQPWVEFNLHGGVRIAQRFIRRMTDLGAQLGPPVPPGGMAADDAAMAPDIGGVPKVQAPCAAGGRRPEVPTFALADRPPVAPDEASFSKLPPSDPADHAFQWLCPLERWVQECLAEAATPRVVQWLTWQGIIWRQTVSAWRTQLIAGDTDSVRLAAEKILSQADLGSLWRGRNLAIIGPPNAGKSSIANRLAGQGVSLVADSPGTTRDWVGQQIALDGWPVLLVDTAGLRETDDPVEAEGVMRAIAQARQADLRLFVVDRSCAPSDSESWLVGQVGLESRDTIAYSKCDLPAGRHPKDGLAGLGVTMRAVQVSSLTGGGWSELERALMEGSGLSALQELQSLVFCGEVKTAIVRLVCALDARERTQALAVLDDLAPVYGCDT